MWETSVCKGALTAASGQQGVLLFLHTVHWSPQWRAAVTGKGEKSSHDLPVHRSLPSERESLLYGIWRALTASVSTAETVNGSEWRLESSSGGQVFVTELWGVTEGMHCFSPRP